MKILLPAALLIALFSTAALSAEDRRSTSSIHWHDGVGEVLIRGVGGTSNINGEVVALRNGIVYVDGQSYGAVAKYAEIRYVVAGNGRSLYVGGKPRKQWTKK